MDKKIFWKSNLIGIKLSSDSCFMLDLMQLAAYASICMQHASGVLYERMCSTGSGTYANIVYTVRT